VIVSHFHWDREWYRTFQSYRARLVDAVDRVLELADADPDYRFLLDGQTVLLEDYLAIRPARRAALERHVRERRLAIGPWYVQPDSLLPSGEAHVRNLLLGRRVGSHFGPVSTVGYVPDSFGHPAQLPQILAGFGIGTFVYWRGNGNELDHLGSPYRWVAPDGSAVEATLLPEGYFNASGLPEDPVEAAAKLAEIAKRLAAEGGTVLLMNGIDHMLPDANTREVAAALAGATGFEVRRGLLEDALGPRSAAAEHRGALLGARVAHLLPGVWSTQMPVKLANHRCQTLLQSWLEPWAALALRFGGPDERAALSHAWRTLLLNQAHDSLCGCSIDPVMEQVQGRFVEVEALARESVTRLLERLAGRGVERRTPWALEQEVAVFNPSPHPRTDVVRLPMEGYPGMRLSLGAFELHPLALAASDPPGFEIDGEPALLVDADDERARWLPNERPFDLEFVARDVPALGWKRFRLSPAARAAELADDGREIECAGLRLRVEERGTLAVHGAGVDLAGLLEVEDAGDRGDSYDFDAVDGDAGARLLSVTCRRTRHPSGIARLCVTRVFEVPLQLEEDRERRSAESVALEVEYQARLAPGVPRIDLAVRLDNRARDHRLRLLFPSGRPARTFRAATTFDAADFDGARPHDGAWQQRAPSTFPHQGWVSVNGLTVAAPGLPEAEVTPAGTIAITLVRSVGWLSRFDLRSRPAPAGPAMPLLAAQVQGRVEAALSLLLGGDAAALALDAETGLRAVFAGGAPLVGDGRPLLALEPDFLQLSALKPAESGAGTVVRVLNPTARAASARLRLGFPVDGAAAVRLDEQPAAFALRASGDTIELEVPPHALRTVLIP